MEDTEASDVEFMESIFEVPVGTECAVCGEVGQDRRTLRISHGYELREVSEKFERTQILESSPDSRLSDPLPAWKLTTCKECRADLMGLLRRWIESGSAVDRRWISSDPERNIPVRIDGAIVMMTREEYDQWRTN